MLDLLDDLAGPMDELSEAAHEAGLGDDLGVLDDANDALQKMLDENGGVPFETYRFLVGKADTDKRTSSSDDTEDLVTQAGHILDNAAGGQGYGKLGAAFANDKLLEGGREKQKDPLQWEMEHPRWAVDKFRCEEGLNQLFRCEVVLLRPSTLPPGGAYTDPFQKFLDSWKFKKTQDQGAFRDDQGHELITWGRDPVLGLVPVPQLGTDPRNTGLAQDLAKGVGGTDTFIKKVLTPDQSLPEFADVEDPDQLHPLAFLEHTILDPVPPTDFLNQPCRLCIARRCSKDKFTISERWFSGVCVEFEDLGVRYKSGFRAVRIVFVPRISRLGHTRRYRVFQGKTALQIVTDIFKEYLILDPDKPVDYPGENIKGVLRLLPPPKELGGVVGVPSAATAMVSQLGGVVDSMAKTFGADTGVAGAIDGALRDSLEQWGNKREYCVQYGETDLEFVERLLAEEGASYFFESAERKETLVIADDAFQAGKKVLTARRLPLASIAAAPTDASLRFVELGWEHEVQRRLAPTSVTLRDSNMTHPRSCTDLQAGETPPGLGGGLSAGSLLDKATSLVSEIGGKEGTEDYAGYDAKWFEYPAGMIFVPDDPTPLWPGAKYKSYDGAALAQILLDRMRTMGAVTVGGSNCSLMNPGHNIRIGLAAFDVLKEDDTVDPKTGTLKKAPRYLVTRAIHTGSSTTTYRNRFEAVHIKLRYRPARKAKPHIGGVHSATILGVDMKDSVHDGQNVPEPQVDERWRVLVRFPWDTRKANADPSAPEGNAHTCWVRAAERWAGAGYGTVLAPRVGGEALVAFENGDPDRPYVLGTMYNGHVESPNDNAFHPYRPASTKPKANESDAQNVGFLWSQSWPAKREVERDKQKSNYLWFNDNRGIEEIVLHAQKDYAESIVRDQITTVLENQTNEVKGKQDEIVSGDQKLYVNYPSKTEDPLDMGREKDVVGNEDLRIGKESAGLRHETIHGNETRTVEKDRKEAVLDTEVLLIEGAGDAPSVDPDGGSTAAPGEGGGATRPAPARALTVHGSQHVKLSKNDELKVTGDREDSVGQAYELNARTIAMQIAGEQDLPEDKRSGLRADEAGIHAGSQGKLLLQSKLLHAVSDDEILFSARTRIRLEAGANLILLDGIEGTISIYAEKQGAVRIGTPKSYLEIKENKFHIQSNDDTFVEGDTSDPSDAAIHLHGSEVKLQFAGEIHFNAQNAAKINHAADSLDIEAGNALEEYRKLSKKYDEDEKKSWEEIQQSEGVDASDTEEKPVPDAATTAPASDDEEQGSNEPDPSATPTPTPTTE